MEQHTQSVLRTSDDNECDEQERHSHNNLTTPNDSEYNGQDHHSADAFPTPHSLEALEVTAPSHSTAFWAGSPPVDATSVASPTTEKPLKT